MGKVGIFYGETKLVPEEEGDYFVYAATKKRYEAFKVNRDQTLKQVFAEAARRENDRTDVTHVHPVKPGSFNYRLVFNAPCQEIVMDMAKRDSLTFESAASVLQRNSQRPLPALPIIFMRTTYVESDSMTTAKQLEQSLPPKVPSIFKIPDIDDTIGLIKDLSAPACIAIGQAAQNLSKPPPDTGPVQN